MCLLHRHIHRGCHFEWFAVTRQREEVMLQLYTSTHLSAAIITGGNPGHPTWSGGKMVTTSKRLSLEKHSCTFVEIC